MTAMLRLPRPLRLLFVKDRLNWPRAAGGDVHGSQMMRALVQRGHQVCLATQSRCSPEAVAGLGLTDVVELSTVAAAEPDDLPAPTRWQRKFESYWGQSAEARFQLATLTREQHFDAVIALGPDAPLLLRGVSQGLRIWYAADDSALHHWSQFQLTQPSTWHHLRLTATFAVYERAIASLVDRVWVVSSADRWAMRLLTGKPVDVVANGVDAEYFRPPDSGTGVLENHLAFWGRLDFGPNEDAVAWFLQRVWPHVQSARPETRFDVFGFQPSRRVTALCHSHRGVRLFPNLPDLRDELGRRPIAVLPFVSGRGIKNKLLEAAALGRAIVCTPEALTGTRGVPPVHCERRPERLARAIEELLANPGERSRLGAAARDWVIAEHSWDSAARIAERAMQSHRDRARASQVCLAEVTG
jgi:glycosyltransferase involved in cell wall biosynthesis